jgi:hypothetical protein
MKKDFYVRFLSVAEAEHTLSEIQAKIGERWADPTPNMTGASCVIPWNSEYLAGLEDLVAGRPRLRADEAMKQGFTLGYHKGRFAQAANKIEDAHFILDALERLYGLADFPTVRTLYYGYQSSLYGARQAIGERCKPRRSEAGEWWAEVDKKLRKEPLIDAMDVDYQRDKHGQASAFLRPKLNWAGSVLPVDVISGEGAYQIVNRGTLRERRRFVPLAPPSTLEVSFDVRSEIVRGNDLSSLPFPAKLRVIIEVSS